MTPLPANTTITHVERMSEAFTKHHLDDGRVLHHFTAPDQDGPHDHPWSFTTEILQGGYVEEVYAIDGTNWTVTTVERLPGMSHHVDARHIHRIVALPTGECWTLVTPGPAERETRFWRFSDGVESRAWFDSEFTSVRVD